MDAAASLPQTNPGSGAGRLLLVLALVIAFGLALSVLAQPARVAFFGLALDIFSSPLPAASVSGNVIVDRKYSHAWEHDDQDIVRNCLDSGRTWKRWYSTQRPDRFLRVCYDGENIILQIVDRIKNELWERTAYLDRELKSISDVVDYTRAVQYLRIKAP